MAKINQIKCADNLGNTGVPACTYDPAMIVGAILAPMGARIMNSFATQLKLWLAETRNAIQMRWRPIKRFLAVEDKSEGANEQSFGYGSKVFTREGEMSWMFTLRGGLCFHKKLSTLNGKQGQLGVFFIDANGVVIGASTKNEDGDQEIKPLSLSQIYVPKAKWPDGSEVFQTFIQFTLADYKELNENYAYIKTEGFNVLTDVNGLTDINLVDDSDNNPPAAGANFIAGTIGCGEQDLVEAFGDQLAIPEAWSVTDSSTGNNVDVTAVTVTDTGYKLVLDTSDPDYAAAKAAKFSLVEPAVLASLGIVDFESNSITMPMG